eukprot:snap_masked-scaffold_2-processed-gene-27.26-mRNA-1 protein AED:1.00 eAED:1.00 QI:0/0/0/0/1/1/2/0/71
MEHIQKTYFEYLTMGVFQISQKMFKTDGTTNNFYCSIAIRVVARLKTRGVTPPLLSLAIAIVYRNSPACND